MDSLLDDPDFVTKGNIEWLSNAIEFDYNTFVIVYDDRMWYASHEDEEKFEEDIIIHSPKDGVEFPGEINLFNEHTLTEEEFNLLRESITNIIDS